MRNFMFTINNAKGYNVTGNIQAEHEFEALRHLANRLQALAGTYPPSINVPRIDSETVSFTIYLEEIG